jgi:formate/nitrite transporter FocA (FNT family)
LDSLLILGALYTGEATFGYLGWMQWLSYTVAGNVIGGLVLGTMLRLVRSKDRRGRASRTGG